MLWRRFLLRMIPAAIFAACVLTGCGPAVSGRVGLTLTLSAFGAGDTLTVYVFAPEKIGGGSLTCSALKSDAVEVDGEVAEQLAEPASAQGEQLESGDVELKIENITAGEGRIFAADVVESASGTRKGFGCTANVTIEANSDVDVKIDVEEM